MSNKRAPLHVWFPVLVFTSAVAFFALWSLRNGHQVLGNVATITAWICMFWLFERV